MKRAVLLITISLAALFSVIGLLLGAGAWILGLWIGAFWGLANAWCLNRAVQCVVAKQKKWRLAAWLAVKFIGLYGSLALLLLVAHISPLGWLAGFGLSLIGLIFGAYQNIRPILVQARHQLLLFGILLF